MDISLEAFRAASNGTYNLGEVVLNQAGNGLEIHNNHKYFGRNKDEFSVEQNRAVREALLKALTGDSGLNTDYVRSLGFRLTGAEVVNNPLSRREIKAIITAHDQMKRSVSSFERLLGKSGAAVSSGNGIAQLAAQAGRAATAALVTDSKYIGLLLAIGNDDVDVTELQVYADKYRAASEKLALAYRLRGDELGTPEARNQARQAVADAVEALLDLSSSLRDAKNDGKIALNEGLRRLMDYADARASELMTVWNEVEIGAAALEAGVTMRDLVAARATKLHGNGKFLADLTEKAQDLEDQLAHLRERAADPESDPIRATELDGLVHGFEALRTALRETGATEGTFALALKNRVTESLRDLGTLQRANVSRMIGQMLEEYVTGSDVSSVLAREGIMDLIGPDGTVDPKALKRTLKGLAGNGSIYGETVPLIEERILLLTRTLAPYGKEGGFRVAPALLDKFLRGEAGLGTVVGAYANGFTDTDIDTDLDDRFLVASKPLGKGGVNKVYEARYQAPGKVGKTRVFKAEEHARSGLSDMTIGRSGYAPENRVFEINKATRLCAEKLGFARTAASVTVGMYDGKVGFFMDKAGGTTPTNVTEASPFSAKTIGKLAAPERLHRLGSLARETCKLEWLDYLTGQMDRHADNYLVDLNDAGEAEATAIDNDAAFMDYRPGLRRFELDAYHFKKLTTFLKTSKVEKLNRLLGGADVPAITTTEDRRQILDLDKVTNPEVLNNIYALFGLNSMSRPSRVPASVLGYLKSVEKSNDYEGAARSLMPGRFTKEQVAATAARLREMVAYAKELEKSNLVMRDEDWFDPAKLKALANEPTGAIEQVKTRKGTLRYANYFQRDFPQLVDLVNKLQ